MKGKLKAILITILVAVCNVAFIWPILHLISIGVGALPIIIFSLIIIGLLAAWDYMVYMLWKHTKF